MRLAFCALAVASVLTTALTLAHATDFSFKNVGITLTIPDGCDVEATVQGDTTSFDASCKNPRMKVIYRSGKLALLKATLARLARKPPAGLEDLKTEGPKELTMPNGFKATSLSYTGKVEGGEEIGTLIMVLHGEEGRGLMIMFTGKHAQKQEVGAVTSDILKSIKKIR